MRRDPRSLRHQDRIAVDELVARRCNVPPGEREQLDAGGAGEARIVRREEIADVAERRCAEERVDQGMAHDVGVGVPVEPALVLDRHAAEHERTSLDEAMRVEPGAHAVAHPIGSWRGSRPRKAVTVR